MVNTPPSKSPEELIAELDAMEDDPHADLSPLGLASASARSMLDKLGGRRREIGLMSSAEVTEQLRQAFRHSRVEIVARETEKINVVTGNSRRTYVVLQAEVLTES